MIATTAPRRRSSDTTRLAPAATGTAAAGASVALMAIGASSQTVDPLQMRFAQVGGVARFLSRNGAGFAMVGLGQGIFEPRLHLQSLDPFVFEFLVGHGSLSIGIALSVRFGP